MKSKKWRIGAMVLSMAILAGAVTGAAFAGTYQSNNSQAADAFYQSFVSKLAANLGVSQDKLTAALDVTKKQMLDEAVQQGKITREQADKMALQKGFGFLGFGSKHCNY